MQQNKLAKLSFSVYSIQIKVGIHVVFFLLLHENICCGSSLEALLLGTHNRFSWRNKKNVGTFLMVSPSRGNRHTFKRCYSVRSGCLSSGNGSTWEQIISFSVDTLFRRALTGGKQPAIHNSCLPCRQNGCTSIRCIVPLTGKSHEISV